MPTGNAESEYYKTKIMNAKEELIRHTVGLPPILHIRINVESTGVFIEGPPTEVMSKLDFDYNSGYGKQDLFGIIWHEGGTWSERTEYDGMEWWEHKKCPDIPRPTLKDEWAVKVITSDDELVLNVTSETIGGALHEAYEQLCSLAGYNELDAFKIVSASLVKKGFI